MRESRSVRPARGRCRLTLLLTLAGSMSVQILAPTWSEAACNAIPAARLKGPYLSTVGGVHQRLAAVGERVLVQADCKLTPRFNQLHPARNEIQFTFQGPSGTTVTRTVLPTDPTFPDCPATAATCTLFEFTMPDFTDATDPDVEKGLVGPVKLKITNLNDPSDQTDDEVVAHIEEIYLPDKTCPQSGRTPETVFGELVVVPKPNVIDTEANFDPNGNELLGALDRNGNLLIPLNFTRELQDTTLPMATLLAGETPSKANSSGAPDEQLALGKRLAGKSGRNKQIRSFDLAGRPLPPLMRIADDGGLFGLVDAGASVIRVERNHRPSGQALKLFNFSDRVVGLAGPVKLTHKLSKEKRAPVPLVGLRSSERTIAYARNEAYEKTDHNDDLDNDDYVPEIVSLKTGTRVSTKLSAATHPVGNALEAVIEVMGEHVAFLSVETDDLGVINGHTQRLYDNTGNDISGSSGNDASKVARIDGSPIALGIDGAYYSEPDAKTDRFKAVRTKPGVTLTIEVPYVEAAMRGDMAVLLVPENQTTSGFHNGDGDSYDNVAHFYMVKPNGDCLVNLGRAGTMVAISDDIIVVAVSERGDASPAIDHNKDNDTNDDVPFTWGIEHLKSVCNPQGTQPSVPNATLGSIPFAVDAIGAMGKSVVFITPEYEQNTVPPHTSPCRSFPSLGFCDLNADLDGEDRVLMVADTSTGPNIDVVSSGYAAEEFQLGSDFVPFRVPEVAQNNKDLNDDQDTSDYVMHVFFPDCPPQDFVKNTEFSALTCTFAGCDARRPYRIDDRVTWFVTDDKQPSSIGIAAVSAKSCGISMPDWFKAEWPLSDVSAADWLSWRISFGNLSVPAGAFTRPGEIAVVGDADNDGVADPLDNCVEFRNADQLDVDGDGVGDRHCDRTPARCPPRPLPPDQCAGPRDVQDEGLCVDDREEDGLHFAWGIGGGLGTEDVGDFGDPVRRLPHYSVCVYSDRRDADGTVFEGAVLPWRRCGKPPCWTGRERDGFHYAAGEYAKDNPIGGIDALTIPGMNEGTDRTWLRGHAKGVRAAELGGRITVQLIMRQDDRMECVSSTHSRIRPSLQPCADPVPELRGRRRE